MPYIISDSFKAKLRDFTTPIVVIAEFHDSSVHSLRYYQVFSIYPFELEHFLTNFDKRGFRRVRFVGLLPPSTGNTFLSYHIVTL